MRKRRVYLDHASSTSVDTAIFDFMKPYFTDKYGNPGGMHLFGQEAQVAIDDSRDKAARFFGCDFSEIVFTGSATEANNLAIRGIVKNTLLAIPNFIPHIVTSKIEHSSVLETLRDLERNGVEVTYLDVNGEGFVNPDNIANAIKDTTILISIMYASNEIGTIQPIQKISQVVLNARKNFSKTPKLSKAANIMLMGRVENHEETSHGKEPLLSGAPYFHTDAVQALNYLDCNVSRLGVDMLTFSGHKIYGPKGIGGLYVKKNTPIASIITGGKQEMGFRSGTENVPYIVGFGMAVEIAGNMRIAETVRLEKLRDYFVREVIKRIPSAKLNGPQKSGRLANNANFLFKGFPANNLIIALDREGIAVSSGATCTIKTVVSSETLMAIGLDKEEAKQSLRFTFGRGTTEKDLEYVLFNLEDIVNKNR
ncbi:MAG: hypothetical protein A3B96_04315 [Candidatus Spechtbacteria bacterium RIFCSPHIGHO2_02_FULL_43_15b]|uniref:cysteine desulfurase n=1 Tax=Candidatus Spechtbacteria bacterium RIFCSPHIGHO2_01_FULL_43_30 TaxID=1802158 RepID=A0A1G2H7V8_9BACT|nr:MAG: hypothetical protein A2827_01880 [Candidatus Spechtbacteria bacterium RIFCSPHIGHO2_01_FULL_43_30]OGZ58559.1 MAG: hypothetical protein A3B96_04315 [Candidatus Spechtbacteria bacterium RIFCSPHIGHO2_02_FULL_43_15b]